MDKVNPVMSAEALLLDENMELKKQIQQLETKRQAVSKVKYDTLMGEYRKLQGEHVKTTKKMAAVENDFKKLSRELQETKEKLLDMKPSKNSERIKALRGQLVEQEKVNNNLHDTIYKLEQEKKPFWSKMLEEGFVTQDEYKGLLKQLDREKQLKEQYQRLYEEEKSKRNELKERFKTEKENPEFWEAQYQRVNSKLGYLEKFTPQEKSLIQQNEELQRKLSRKGTGKPRNNNTTDEDVLRLKEEGNTIRDIVSLTGLSTATITKILKGFKGEK